MAYRHTVLDFDRLGVPGGAVGVVATDTRNPRPAANCGLIIMKPTTPSEAKEELTSNYGYDEDDIVAGGDFITVYGTPDVNNPLGGVFYAVNNIGWRVFSTGEADDGRPYASAQVVHISDAPGWMRITGDKAVRRQN